MPDIDGDAAISPCFSVTVEGQELGVFASCEGLGCEVVVEQREEGGNNSFVHQLPVRIKYPNIKLTRPLNRDSTAVAAWLSSMGGDIKRTTAKIDACTADGTVIASWKLDGVIPIRWQGPSLNVDTLKPAMETLEIAHHGFLEV
jgi:phage tail-like protein